MQKDYFFTSSTRIKPLCFSGSVFAWLRKKQKKNKKNWLHLAATGKIRKILESLLDTGYGCPCCFNFIFISSFKKFVSRRMCCFKAETENGVKYNCLFVQLSVVLLWFACFVVHQSGHGAPFAVWLQNCDSLEKDKNRAGV